MQVIQTALPGILILEPKVFRDERGFFMESYNSRVFAQATGFTGQLVQENHSRSCRGVLRGLHYQMPPVAQGKLVRAMTGEIYDVVVDIRRSSPTFGRHIGVTLSAENNRLLWVPPGFAHGFLAISPTVDLLYKTTDYWSPAHERAILWNDPALGVAWPLEEITPLLSPKDVAAKLFKDADYFD